MFLHVFARQPRSFMVETTARYRSHLRQLLDSKFLLSDCQAEYSPFSHRSALTFPDRNRLTENHQGGKTGGLTVRMKFRIYVLISGAEKSYGGIAQLVERLVRKDFLWFYNSLGLTWTQCD